MDSEYYAVVQKFNDVITVFGIGTTEEDAYADSLEWIEDDSNDLTVVPCTQYVYCWVEQHGGVGDFVIDNGTLKLWEEDFAE